MKRKNKNIFIILLWILGLLFSSCNSQNNTDTPSISNKNSWNNYSNNENTIKSQNNTPNTNTHAS